MHVHGKIRVPRGFYWCVTSVVTLFKKGCKDKPGNCRAVSATAIVGKLIF